MILNQLDIDSLDYINDDFLVLGVIEQLAKKGKLRCPNCGNKVYVHGSYVRKVINSEFEKINAKIVKVKCTDPFCQKVHAVIPNFIIPHKQYGRKTVQQALLHNKNSYCPADDSTILRWKREKMKDYGR